MFATRDVFALLLSCFAVYYSTFSEGVVSFDPAFVVSSEGGMGGGCQVTRISTGKPSTILR